MRLSARFFAPRAVFLVLVVLLLWPGLPTRAEKTPLEGLDLVASQTGSAPTTPPATPAAVPPAEIKGPAQFALRITRIGDFLKDVGAEKRELMRRLGRKLAEMEEKFLSNRFQAAGFAAPGTDDKPLTTSLLEEKEWSAGNRTAFEELFQQGNEILKTLAGDVPTPATGLLIEAIAAPDKVVQMVDAFLDNPNAAKNLRPGQLFKLKNNFLPLMKMADRVAILGSVTPDGLKLRFRVNVNASSKELIGAMAKNATTPSTARFIDSEALVNVAQIQAIPEPNVVMAQLKAFPQTAIVQSYLASAGLDLEKDILPTNAQDSLISLNLTPTGEGGIPDLRIISKLRDAAAIEVMAPKLRQLAMSIGVYVTSGDAAGVPCSKISYFMVPNFALHVAMTDGYLVLATARENLAASVTRIKDVLAGKIKGFEVPGNVQRFWRVSLSRINEQLQRLLQSPLLANKGIPPMSNISAADELGDLLLMTRIFEDRLEISVDLPVLPGK